MSTVAITQSLHLLLPANKRPAMLIGRITTAIHCMHLHAYHSGQFHVAIYVTPTCLEIMYACVIVIDVDGCVGSGSPVSTINLCVWIYIMSNENNN